MTDPDGSTYEELCTNYDPVVNELPPPEDRTIFDISKYPHYENVISNWYAFFFEPAAEHSLRDLFLQSLVEIIRKDREFSMEDCRVEREFRTEKGKSIDLVLYEQSENSELFETAIIVENKINAEINNDLEDYYNSVKSDQKVGVVLSLHKINQDLPKEFININHKTLLEEIKRNLGKYVVSAKLKYIIYLQDFISNLEKMTSPEKMQAHIKYYFNNAPKIDELLKLRDQAKGYLKDNLRDAVQHHDVNYKLMSDAEGAFRFAYHNGSILLYLYTIEKICTEKKFELSVWLHGDQAIRHWNDAGGRDKISKGKYEHEHQLKLFPHKSSTRWESLADKEYEIKNIENFGETVVQFLEDDWSKFLNDVKEILTQAKNPGTGA